MMTEVACIAITVAREGCVDHIYQALQDLIKPTRHEPGFIQYDLHRDMNNPRGFVFYERWLDETTFNAHCNSPHVIAYLNRTKEWIEHSEFKVLKRGII